MTQTAALTTRQLREREYYDEFVKRTKPRVLSLNAVRGAARLSVRLLRRHRRHRHPSSRSDSRGDRGVPARPEAWWFRGLQGAERGAALRRAPQQPAGTYDQEKGSVVRTSHHGGRTQA